MLACCRLVIILLKSQIEVNNFTAIVSCAGFHAKWVLDLTFWLVRSSERRLRHPGTNFYFFWENRDLAKSTTRLNHSSEPSETLKGIIFSVLSIRTFRLHPIFRHSWPVSLQYLIRKVWPLLIDPSAWIWKKDPDLVQSSVQQPLDIMQLNENQVSIVLDLNQSHGWQYTSVCLIQPASEREHQQMTRCTHVLSWSW